MKQVEASAPTREEAIQKALVELGAEMYEVDDIKILDEGSKGLFGFGARPARVMVSIEGRHEEPQRGRRDAQPPREQPKREPRGEQQQPREQQKRDARPARTEEPAARAPREEKRDDNRDTPSGDRPPRKRGQRGRRGGKSEGGASEQRPAAVQAGGARPERSDRPERAPRPERAERPERAPREDRPRRDPAEPRPERPRREPRAHDESAGMESDTEAFAAITDEQGQQAAVLLQEVITQMGIAAQVAFVRSEDGAARLDVKSEDGAILIGRKGSTLNALQYLVNRMIPAEDGESLERVVVDVEGYLDRRRESLQELALSFADKAKRAGRSMKLKPMSPQERRIVHLALQEDPDVRTFSQGESLFRAVVISPRGEGAVATKPAGQRGQRGGRNRGGRSNRPRRNDSEIDVGALGD